MATKFNYKIRNKKTGKFYSTGRKSTWQQKQAVINFVEKLKKEERGYVKNEFGDIEVLIFPLEDAIVVSANDFIEQNKAELDEKKVKREEKEKKHRLANEAYRLEYLKKQIKDLEKEIEKLNSIN